MSTNFQSEIPGYFWDPEKQRYFKVEQNHHAARHDAPWSSDNVKKRKLNEVAAAEKAHYEARSLSRITRSRVFNEPLMGGFLAREHGDDVRDLRAASFAQGLVEKGKTSLRERTNRNLEAMFVSKKKDENGVYPVVSYGTYIPYIIKFSIARDEETGRMQESPIALDLHSLLVEDGYPVITDIKCDATGSRAFVSSTSVGAGSVGFLSIRLDSPGIVCDTVQYAYSYSCRSNAICTSPPGQTLQCLMGTNLGLAALDERNHVRVVAVTDFDSGGDYRSSGSHDIFGVDYHVTNPNLVFFGGRPGKLCIGDLRQNDFEWSAIQLPKSIAHVKAVNDNQVLVAGLENMMSVYDIRFCDRTTINDNRDIKSGRGCKKGGDPIVTMQEYKSQSRFNTGFDFDRTLGIAAAAHEDGKVVLYSVRSGRRLPSRDIDKIHSRWGQIECLQFQTMEDDHTPTLFVGEGNDINAFSFGVDNLDDEC
ncbi:uncharacterized protein F4807DRAFT_61698 [Annulohypoxylon truncatum]|uniref:uncharacterized protein n=1 Tax=Annulohypoxylon truncatum TaxID=327061 RepID=UPI002007DBA9|nr:uncharacterized protein F4807DRAFT_61698 [Annulohypoxylon truncatum]KAI1210347.1 hypothetical protein F4807DRAFT_61698 [Annulohypoxylon truncatum]